MTDCVVGSSLHKGLAGLTSITVLGCVCPRRSLSSVWGFSASRRRRHLILSPLAAQFHTVPLSIRTSWSFYPEAQGSKRANVKASGPIKGQSPNQQSGYFCCIYWAGQILLDKASLLQGEGKFRLLIELVSCAHREGRNCWQLIFETIYKKGTLFFNAARINFSHFFQQSYPFSLRKLFFLLSIHVLWVKSHPQLKYNVRDLGLGRSVHRIT